MEKASDKLMLQSAIKVCFTKHSFLAPSLQKCKGKPVKEKPNTWLHPFPSIVQPLSASNQKLYTADMFRKHSPGLHFILAIYVMDQKDIIKTIIKTNIYITFYMIIQAHFKSLCMLI